MQKIIITIALFFIPSMSLAQYRIDTPIIAYPVSTEIGLAQQAALEKLPAVLIEESLYYMRASWAAQKLAGKCAHLNIQIFTASMQEPEGEDKTSFDFDYVQNKVLNGLNNDAAEAITKQGFAAADSAIIKAEGVFNLPSVVHMDPKAWCRIAGPEIMRVLLRKFNDVNDEETTSFKRFIIAKDQYTKALRALADLRSSR